MNRGRRNRNPRNSEIIELDDSDLDEIQSELQIDDDDDTDFYFPQNEQIPKPMKPQ